MKKILFTLSLSLLIQFVFGQGAFPPFINYQFVLRDNSGAILPPNTTGTLRVNIYDDTLSNSPTYQEDHAINTGSIGIVSLKIGKGVPIGTNTFSGSINWAGGMVSYEVFYNSVSVGGRQRFATVPYAIYARSSGGTLPQGQANQTLFWNGNTGQWTPSNNLSHNGSNVGIGISPAVFGNKLHVTSASASDTSVIFAVKNSANNHDAALRGIVYGTANSASFSTSDAIYGLEAIAGNGGTAPGIGVSALGISNNYAFGVSAVASANTPTGYAFGVYGAAANSSVNPNAYGGYFDGRVYIGDTSLYFSPAASAIGNVLTMVAPGKAAFRSVGSASSSILFTSVGISTISPVSGNSFTINTPAPTFTSLGIGSILGPYPNYSLNIPSPIISYNPASGTFTFNQGPSTNTLNLSPALSLAMNTLSVGSNTINLPGLGLWVKNTSTVTELGNPADFVGIGTNAPTNKLHVSNGDVDIDLMRNYRVGNEPGLSRNAAGILVGSNLTTPLIFQAGTEKMRILANGNVGIGISTPLTQLHVNGTLTVVDGNEGDGKVMVSNAGGTGLWKSSPNPTSYTGLNGSSVSISNAPTVLGTGLMQFSKFYASTRMFISLQTRAYHGSFTGGAGYITYEIRVDGNASLFAGQYVSSNSGATEYISINGYFGGLTPGLHTITIVAYTNTGGSTGVALDLGGFGGKVIVKEEF